MYKSNVIDIEAWEQNLVDFISEESEKEIFVLSESGSVMYSPQNHFFRFGHSVKVESSQQIIDSLELLNQSSLESAIAQLKIDSQQQVLLSGKLEMGTDTLKVKGKLIKHEKSSYYWLMLKAELPATTQTEVFQKLIENTSDVIAYYNANEELVYVSPSIFQLTGYTPKEIKDMPSFSLAHPDDKEKVASAIEEDIRLKSPEYRFSYRIRHKSGHYLWVETVSRRNYDSEGELIEAILNFRSIDEKVKAEESLLYVEQRYESLVSKAPFGVAIHDTEKVLYANETAVKILKAKKSAEFVGYEIQKVIHPDYREMTRKRLTQLLEGENLPLIEQKFISMDGSIVDVEITGALVSFRGKTCVQNIFWDVSQRKNVEELLANKQNENEKINQELDKFLYSTAHDLRAPIASSLGLLNLCEHEEKSDSMTLYLSMLAESIHQLDAFIDDISDLSKNARVEIVPKEFRPCESVEKAFSMFDSLKLKHEVNLINNWNMEVPLVTDPERFQLILNNLFSNILRFYNPSRVPIKASVQGKVDAFSCKFTLKDNGLGIPKEHINNVFNMFYRAHDTQSGSGLGLYIVKETVEKLGGTISVGSDTRVGTTFTIVLPNNFRE